MTNEPTAKEQVIEWVRSKNYNSITVCDACETASCWEGTAYCERFRTAGTKEVFSKKAMTSDMGKQELEIALGKRIVKMMWHPENTCIIKLSNCSYIEYDLTKNLEQQDEETFFKPLLPLLHE